MGNWIPGYEWTGLPGAPDADADGETPEDLPSSSYGNIDLWESVEGVGGNEGTGESLVEMMPIQQADNGSVDLDQTLGVPQLPWTLIIWLVVGGAALWLLRPVLEIGAGVTN